MRTLPLVLLVAACGGKGDTGTVTGTTTAGTTGTTTAGTTGTTTAGTTGTTTAGTTGTTTAGTTGAPPSLAEDVQPIFDANCALAGCHAADNPAQGLDLSPGASYDALVGVPSTEDARYNLVEPGDADSSYLVHKVEGTASVGSPMPPPSASLPTEEREMIRLWIDMGAHP